MQKIIFILLLFSQCLFSQTTFEKAEMLFKEKKYTEAKGLFENYLKLKPNHQKTIEYLGDIAGSSKKWDIAIDYYKKLKNQNPDRPFAAGAYR